MNSIYPSSKDWSHNLLQLSNPCKLCTGKKHRFKFNTLTPVIQECQFSSMINSLFMASQNLLPPPLLNETFRFNRTITIIWFQKSPLPYNWASWLILYTGKYSPQLYFRLFCPYCQRVNSKCLKVPIFKRNFVRANSRWDETVCKWRRMKITQGEDNPVYSNDHQEDIWHIHLHNVSPSFPSNSLPSHLSPWCNSPYRSDPQWSQKVGLP